MSTYAHAAFIANARDEWLTDAWAELRADDEQERA